MVEFTVATIYWISDEQIIISDQICNIKICIYEQSFCVWKVAVLSVPYRTVEPVDKDTRISCLLTTQRRMEANKTRGIDSALNVMDSNEPSDIFNFRKIYC